MLLEIVREPARVVFNNRTNVVFVVLFVTAKLVFLLADLSF